MRSILKPSLVLLLAVALIAAACSSDSRESANSDESSALGDSSHSPEEAASTTEVSTAQPASTDAFSVGPLPESLEPLASSFSKYVDVWGINIVATAATDDESILHAANVMAQYLDNDADGRPDNPKVLASMIDNRATLLMGATPDEFESLDAGAVFGFVGQGGKDLYASETNPPNGFDASLEEVHHLILNTGWSNVFPEQLGQAKGSALAEAMDIARGGQFDTIPDPYPAGAWYTYDDETCDYTCMVTEYTYWIHTSLLGGQEGRADEIGQEWRLETPDKARDGDPIGTAVVEDPALGLPTVLPDGDHQPTHDVDGQSDSAAPSRAVTDLFLASGNPDAATVIVVAQGGPATKLFPAEEVADVLPGLDMATVQIASVHQVQTLDPARFTETDLTFEQAQAATTESIAHLAAVVDHFANDGKHVLVAGISYGAFVVQELLATQGSVADGYLISVGRIDMPESVWSVFAEGMAAGFVEGTQVVEFTIEEAGMGAGTAAGDRNMARLAASLGMNRYSELLAETPLDNVVYVSGTLDEQVGRLTDAEVAFLTASGVDLIQYDGGHGTPDAISADAVERLLAHSDE